MPINVRVLLLIKPPSCTSEVLERALEAHPAILTPPPPHILTPLAFLGYHDKVYKAPYDAILAAEAQRLFVQRLPRGNSDYTQACRAYCDALYSSALQGAGRTILFDKTPDHALILPFLAEVFPDAAYVVLARHPLALWVHSLTGTSSNGGAAAATRLARSISDIAGFLRSPAVTHVRVRYEDLGAEPRRTMKEVFDYLELPFDMEFAAGPANDPQAWVEELRRDPLLWKRAQRFIARLDEADLAAFGYPLAELWRPVEAVVGRPVATRRFRRAVHAFARRVLRALCRSVRRLGILQRTLRKAGLACDVLLRE